MLENYGVLIMNNLLFGLVFALSVSSCTTMQKSTSVLYDKYSQYEKSVSKENISEVARDFFSPSLLGKDYRIKQNSVNQLLFKNNMVTEDSHFEKMHERHGCLSINGYDEKNNPLIFFLKFISKDSRWLIDKINVVYINDINGFVNSAKCPSEYPE
jgi:hypothetical protein